MLHYVTDIQPREPATDAQIADAINADPSRYKPVASNAVLEWLGVGGRKVKLDRFVAQAKDSLDQTTMVALGAVGTVLIASTNATSYLTLDPTSEQYALLLGLVDFGVLSQADADALLDKARMHPSVTGDDVAAARAAHALLVAKEARLVAMERYASAYRAAVDAADSVDSLPPEVAAQ